MKVSSYTCLFTTLQKFAIENLNHMLELMETWSQEDTMFVMDASTTG